MIHSSRGVLLLLFGMIAGVATGCDSAGAKALTCSTGSTTTSNYVPGWLCVNFGLSPDYVAKNRGQFFETYDEYVGGLLDDGLNIDRSIWLKPTYGNENLLWTMSSKLALDRIKKSSEMSDDFPNYKIDKGTLRIDDIEWQYSGYLIPATENETKAFQDYQFACNQTESGVAVFYWGSLHESLSPVEYDPVRKLLTHVARHCE